MLIVLLGYTILSLIYNAASPIFEPTDEATHYRYVKYLLDHRSLPILIDGPNRDELWGLHQPPLAFFLSAIVASPFDLSAPDDVLARNPHVNLGVAHRPGNKNYYIHTESEAFPYQGIALQVRLLRLVSMLCGAATLVVVYAASLDVFRAAGDRHSVYIPLALLPPAFMALHPQFIFINAEIANEPLNILLMAAGLWGCIRLLNHGPGLRLALFLGIVAGLIAITKMTGLALMLIIVLAMLMATLRRFSAAQLWQFSFIVAALIIVFGGWWYNRNLLIYGDPWQANMYREFYGDSQRAITFRDWIGGILAGEVSFWATFGWLNIVVPERMYWFYKTLVRVALLGVGVYFIRWFLWRSRKPAHTGAKSPLLPPSPARLLLLLISPLASSLILTRLIATEGGIQGRQLLPMLPALAIIIVIGYHNLLPGRWFYAVSGLIGAVMAALALIIPFLYIAPAYAPPPLLTESALPDDMVPLERTYGEQIRLLGYRLEAGQVRTGEETAITLYWQALKPVGKDYTTFIHALGRGLTKVGEVNGYAGQGNFPPSRWPVGPIIEDRYTFTIDPAAQAPTLMRLNVGFFDHERQDLPPLQIVDAQGDEAPAHVAQQVLVAAGSGADEPCSRMSVTFAGQISLRCADLLAGEAGQKILRLRWSVDARPQQDYTVFIQLWQDGRQVAGFDGPPFKGDLPTIYWQPEFRLVDDHVLDLSQLPAGDYRLVIGLYNPLSGERLPAFGPDGSPLPDFALDLGTVTISNGE